MNSFEEEKAYWQNLLDKGEINLETYNRQMKIIEQRANFDEQHNENNTEKQAKDKKLKNFKILILIVMIVCAIIMYNKDIFVAKSKYISTNLEDLPSPLQEKTKGSATKIIDDINIDIKYIYSYIINGRVVNTYSYVPVNTQNKLSPKDVGLTWGFLAKDEYNNKIKWSSSGNRFLRWKIDDGNWYREEIGEYEFNTHVSNNHLIPCDENIENLINKIKEGDYIRITGYLVNVNYDDKGRNTTWNSSISRVDTGNGACELVYVTNIEWLK